MTNTASFEIRLCRPGEFAAVQEVERDAGQRFADIGMASIAAGCPRPLLELQRALADERLWVATSEPPPGERRIVGFAMASVVDTLAHIDEVSVHRDVAGHGVGRTLIDTVVTWARARHRDGVTLSTFDHVPWNRPYYERLGFVVISPQALGPQLRAKLHSEAQTDLGRWPRVCMRYQF